MDLPGGVHPDHPGVFSRGEGLAGPSPSFGEISMRGAERPGALMVKDRKMRRFQADAGAIEGKLFLTFFPEAQRNFAGPEDRLFVGGDEEECLPALSVIR